MSNVAKWTNQLILERRLDTIAQSGDASTAVRQYAEEMVARHTAIRNGFANLFRFLDYDSFDNGYGIVTPKIALAPAGEKSEGTLGLRLAARFSRRDDAVSLTFNTVYARLFDNEKQLGNQEYRPNEVVDVTVAGNDYYAWVQGFAGNANVDPYPAAFRQLGDTMYDAETLQSDIWQALGDVSLNPQQAHKLTQPT